MALESQKTAQWFAERIGCLTASKAHAALKGRKANGELYACVQDVIDAILVERITGMASEGCFNDAMMWGIEHEDEARSRYEVETGAIVSDVGFVRHPFIPFLGASPDGLVGADGLVEIKCPTTIVQLRRVREGKIPDEYRTQMLVQLACTGRKWCDFVSYDPRINIENLQFWRVRFTPEESELIDVENRCVEFLAEVDRQLMELTIEK